MAPDEHDIARAVHAISHLQETVNTVIQALQNTRADVHNLLEGHRVLTERFGKLEIKFYQQEKNK